MKTITPQNMMANGKNASPDSVCVINTFIIDGDEILALPAPTPQVWSRMGRRSPEQAERMRAKELEWLAAVNALEEMGERVVFAAVGPNNEIWRD